VITVEAAVYSSKFCDDAVFIYSCLFLIYGLIGISGFMD
jgi:hypothetical protein